MKHIDAYCVEEGNVIYGCFRWLWLAKLYVRLHGLRNVSIRKRKVLRVKWI